MILLALLFLLFHCGDGSKAVPEVLGPECRYQSDDPLCRARCHGVCRRPVCSYLCTGSELAICAEPKCKTVCPPVTSDTPITNTCPSCETHCQALHCRPTTAPCEILCEAPVCGWKCRRPTLAECPLPHAEIQCEMPACEADFEDENGAVSTRGLAASCVVVIIIGAVLVFA